MPIRAAPLRKSSPGVPPRDPDSRFPHRPNRETGDFPIPGQTGNRGFPPRFPAKNRESGPIRGIQFPITRRVSPSINRSGLGIYSAASIMPVLSQAACGSYSGSERGSMLLSSASRDCARLLAEVGTCQWLSLALMSCDRRERISTVKRSEIWLSDYSPPSCTLESDVVLQ